MKQKLKNEMETGRARSYPNADKRIQQKNLIALLIQDLLLMDDILHYPGALNYCIS